MAHPTKIIIGISLGDPNGVGLEIILRIFEDRRMFDFSLSSVWSSSSGSISQNAF